MSIMWLILKISHTYTHTIDVPIFNFRIAGEEKNDKTVQAFMDDLKWALVNCQGPEDMPTSTATGPVSHVPTSTATGPVSQHDPEDVPTSTLTTPLSQHVWEDVPTGITTAPESQHDCGMCLLVLRLRQ